MPTPDDKELRREICTERQELAEAVTTLRTEIASAKDIKGKLRTKLPAIAAGTAGIAFVALGGVRRTIRLVARRGR
jgi:hypothetical protein